MHKLSLLATLIGALTIFSDNYNSINAMTIKNKADFPFVGDYSMSQPSVVEPSSVAEIKSSSETNATIEEQN